MEKNKLELQKQYIEVKKKYDELSEKYWDNNWDLGIKTDIRIALLKSQLEKEIKDTFILLKSLNKQIYYEG